MRPRFVGLPKGHMWTLLHISILHWMPCDAKSHWDHSVPVRCISFALNDGGRAHSDTINYNQCKERKRHALTQWKADYRLDDGRTRGRIVFCIYNIHFHVHFDIWLLAMVIFGQSILSFLDAAAGGQVGVRSKFPVQLFITIKRLAHFICSVLLFVSIITSLYWYSSSLKFIEMRSTIND